MILCNSQLISRKIDADLSLTQLAYSEARPSTQQSSPTMPKGQQQKRNHKKSTKKEVENLPEKLVEFLNTLPTRAKKGSNAKQDIKRIIKLNLYLILEIKR